MKSEEFKAFTDAAILRGWNIPPQRATMIFAELGDFSVEDLKAALARTVELERFSYPAFRAAIFNARAERREIEAMRDNEGDRRGADGFWAEGNDELLEAHKRLWTGRVTWGQFVDELVDLGASALADRYASHFGKHRGANRAGRPFRIWRRDETLFGDRGGGIIPVEIDGVEAF